MNLDVEGIGTSMIDAARAEVAERWPQLRVLAETELRDLAQSLAGVAEKVSAGEIKEAHARQLVHMHQLAARSILLTIEGIGLLTAEQAIHAGVRAAAKAVNSVVKFTLL